MIVMLPEGSSFSIKAKINNKYNIYMNEDGFVDMVLTMSDLIDGYHSFFNSGHIVYHYASFEAALSITSNFSCVNGGSVLYHTIYNCLSDINEGNEAYKIYLKAVKQYIIDKKPQKEVADLLLTIKPNDNYMFYDSQSPNIDRVYFEKGIAYICCFSKESDSKKLWDIYLKGSKSGFALGFNITNLISDSKRYFGENYRHFIKNVLYEEKDKVNYIYFFLEKLLNLTDNLKYIKYYVQTFINANRFVFKNEILSFENEVRSIIIIPESKLNSFLFTNNENKKTLPHKYNFGISIDSLIYFSCEYNPDDEFILSQINIENIMIRSKFNK